MRQAASRRPHEPEVVEAPPRAGAGSGDRATPRWRARRRRPVGVLGWASSTPGRLRLQFTAIAVAATAVLVISCGVLIAVQVTVAGVQQRTVTAIVGVQRVHAWLAAADRSAANAYLSGSGNLTLPQLQYQADIAAATRELEQAAERNVTSPRASQLLQSVGQALTEYTRQVDTASVEGRLRKSSDGVDALRAASGQMHRPRDGILAREHGRRSDPLRRPAGRPRAHASPRYGRCRFPGRPILARDAFGGRRADRRARARPRRALPGRRPARCRPAGLAPARTRTPRAG